MDFDTCLWDEIQDMPGEIFDFENDLLAAQGNEPSTPTPILKESTTNTP